MDGTKDKDKKRETSPIRMNYFLFQRTKGVIEPFELRGTAKLNHSEGSDFFIVANLTLWNDKTLAVV